MDKTSAPALTGWQAIPAGKGNDPIIYSGSKSRQWVILYQGMPLTRALPCGRFKPHPVRRLAGQRPFAISYGLPGNLFQNCTSSHPTFPDPRVPSGWLIRRAFTHSTVMLYHHRTREFPGHNCYIDVKRWRGQPTRRGKIRRRMYNKANVGPPIFSLAGTRAGSGHLVAGPPGAIPAILRAPGL